MCVQGRCVSCEEVRHGCQDGDLCVLGVCKSTDELDACEDAGYSNCGDGILQAPEGCDGGPGCEDCVSTSIRVEPWGEPGHPRAMAVSREGRVAVATSADDVVRVAVFEPDGTPRWVSAGFFATGLLWVDGALFAWGADELRVFDGAAGNERAQHELGTFEVGWSDTQRAFLGGQIDQPNSPTPRGAVAALDAQGVVLWHERQLDMRSVHAVVPVGDGIAIAGQHVSLPRTVVRRVGTDGVTLWSDTSLHGVGRQPLVPDGEGGVWLAQGRGDVVRFDASGEVVATLPCFGFHDRGPAHVAVGPGGELAMLYWRSGDESWIVRGRPDDAAQALSTGRVTTMAWGPRGQLWMGGDAWDRMQVVSW